MTDPLQCPKCSSANVIFSKKPQRHRAAAALDDAFRPTAHSCCSEGDWYKVWVLRLVDCGDALIADVRCQIPAELKLKKGAGPHDRR